MLDKKYLVLKNNYSVAYTEENCYVNEKEYRKNDDDISKSKDVAEELRQNFYKDFLKKHYKNIVVLTAAGTSVDNGENKGKSREGLWEYCKTEIDRITNYLTEDKDNRKIKSIIDEKNIEALLSHLIIYEKLYGEITVKEKSLKKELEIKIASACKLDLSPHAPHKDFLRKITARKNNDTRIQLFTTNYDTLFEQAASEAGFVVIDGFSFTQPREFSGKWFDLDIVNRDKTRIKKEESFLPEVFHLYKLHGSLNWIKQNGRIMQCDDATDPLIIYPADEKYESSYEQPYFEMMSRFQQSLRKENTLLIVIGFGFQDKHINNVIFEAVEQNPGFQLLILNYNNSDGIETDNLSQFFHDLDKKEVKLGVNIVFDTFGGFTRVFPENFSYIIKSGELNESI